MHLNNQHPWLFVTANLAFTCVTFGNFLFDNEGVQKPKLFDNQNSSDNILLLTSNSVPLKITRYYGSYYCTDDRDCRGHLEICDHNSCNCPESYQYNSAGKCEQCPGLGGSCDICCNDVGLVCLNEVCACIDQVCQSSQGVFITASQIALSAALLMGFAALAMVIYRLCTKPRYLSPRHRTAEEAMQRISWEQTSGLRASLSSIQGRVLARLRDRPPTYDNHYRARREAAEIAQRNVHPLEPPPPYGEQRDSDIYHPPAYSEIILAPREFINAGYEETERRNSFPSLRQPSSEPKEIMNSTL